MTEGSTFLELRGFKGPEIAIIKRYFLYFGIFGLSMTDQRSTFGTIGTI